MLCHSTAGWGVFFLYSEFDLFWGTIYTVLHLQIIASISPKASVENSSAQWAIFIYYYCSDWGNYSLPNCLWTDVELSCMPKMTIIIKDNTYAIHKQFNVMLIMYDHIQDLALDYKLDYLNCNVFDNWRVIGYHHKQTKIKMTV